MRLFLLIVGIIQLLIGIIKIYSDSTDTQDIPYPKSTCIFWFFYLIVSIFLYVNNQNGIHFITIILSSIMVVVAIIVGAKGRKLKSKAVKGTAEDQYSYAVWLYEKNRYLYEAWFEKASKQGHVGAKAKLAEIKKDRRKFNERYEKEKKQKEARLAALPSCLYVEKRNVRIWNLKKELGEKGKERLKKILIWNFDKNLFEQCVHKIRIFH